MKWLLDLIKMWFEYHKERNRRIQNNHTNEAVDFDYQKYGLYVNPPKENTEDNI